MQKKKWWRDLKLSDLSISAHTTPSSQAKYALCEGLASRVPLALDVPIITAVNQQPEDCCGYCMAAIPNEVKIHKSYGFCLNQYTIKRTIKKYKRNHLIEQQ